MALRALRATAATAACDEYSERLSCRSLPEQSDCFIEQESRAQVELAMVRLSSNYTVNLEVVHPSRM